MMGYIGHLNEFRVSLSKYLSSSFTSTSLVQKTEAAARGSRYQNSFHIIKYLHQSEK
jgi:hypothetical protein